MRSDEVRLIARELLYLMLDIDVEDAELDFDASDLIERVLAAGPNDTEVVTARVDAVADQAPEFAALARVLTSKFLLCAVLDDVAKRRLVKFAYDEPLGRPDRRSHFYGTQGCTEAASYHVELAVPEGMRARSADIVDNRTGEQLLEGPHDSDRPGLHYVAGAGAEIEPGLRVRLRHRARRVPRAGDARGVGDHARARVGVAVRGPARDRGRRAARRWRCCCRSRPCSRAWCCARASIRWSSSCWRATGCCWARRRSRPWPPAARWPSAARRCCSNWTWGLGAVVALVAAGILSIEVARAPATAKRP